MPPVFTNGDMNVGQVFFLFLWPAVSRAAAILGWPMIGIQIDSCAAQVVNRIWREKPRFPGGTAYKCLFRRDG